MDVREYRDLIDRWDEINFTDPAKGSRHADLCLDLVAELDYPPDLHARALAMYGSSRRTLGDLDAAEATYSQALRIYDTLDSGPERSDLLADEADLHRRLAYLRAFQQRYGEALEAVRYAMRLQAAVGDRHAFGRALVARGSVLLMMDDSRCVQVLSRSLSYLDSEIWYSCLPAVSNLTYALTLFHDLTPRSLERALHLITKARLSLRSRSRQPASRNLAGYRRLTPIDANLRYLQGRLLVLLELYDKARPLLESARADLRELGLPREMAAASLELAECIYHLSGKHRWYRIGVLCAEVLAVLAEQPSASETVAVYSLLEAVVREHSEEGLFEQLSTARSTLARPG